MYMYVQGTCLGIEVYKLFGANRAVEYIQQLWSIDGISRDHPLYCATPRDEEGTALITPISLLGRQCKEFHWVLSRVGEEWLLEGGEGGEGGNTLKKQDTFYPG